MSDKLVTAAKRIVVLVSGRGSNLQALIRAQSSGQFGGVIVGVISNNPAALALDLAIEQGIETESFDHKQFASRELFDKALQDAIEAKKPDLVILAGFMRILSSSFVQHFRGRLINIHPSLLPKHKGLNTHKAALAANESSHGCTVHFVNSNLDGGAIIARASLPIEKNDTAETLAARVLELEHQLLPICVQWYCCDRLALGNDDQALLDHKPLPKTGLNLDLHI